MKSIFIYCGALFVLFAVYEIKAKKIPRIFENLKQVEQYAATLEEYPEPDNTDLENPNFATYLRTLVPSWISRQLEARIGLGVGGWSASGFQQLLKTVVKMRENNGYKGRFIEVQNPKPGDRYVIVGELHGAFHSFVRDLRDWVNKGIINEEFKIIKPAYDIVINGGVTSRSPYIVQTLTLIARLLYVNPDRVIYIRGVHEDKERWKHYGLKDELHIFAAHISREKIPLQSLMNRFFDTLPLALYLIADKKEKLLKVVRISNYGRSNKELDEKNFAALLADERCTVCRLGQKKKSDTIIDVRALIRGEQFLKPVNIQEGLITYGKEEGATSWFLLSAPTKTYRTLFNFYYDTYAILTVYESLDDWTLTLRAHDVRDLEGFQQIKVIKLLSGIEVPDKMVQEGRFKLLQQKLKEAANEIETIKHDIELLEIAAQQPKRLGYKKSIPQPVSQQQPALQPTSQSKPVAQQAPSPVAPAMVAVPVGRKEVFIQPEQQKKEQPRGVPGVSAAQAPIVIGSSMDLSRSLKSLSQWLKAAIEGVFREASTANNHIARRIDFVVRDDAYDPTRAAENVNYFLDVLKTDILLCPLGTPTLLAYIKKVIDNKLLVLFPITGATQFHSPMFNNIINLRASYDDEGKILARYALETLKAKKIVIYYQKDIPDIQGILEIFKKSGFTNFSEVTYDAQKIESNEQAKRIIAASPDVVILFAIPQSAHGLINALGKEIQDIRMFLCWSILAGDAFQNQARSKGIPIVVSSVVPNPSFMPEEGQSTKQLPVIQEFQAFAKRNNIPFDATALEGYLAARTFLYLVSAVQGEVDKDKIRTVAENMNDYRGIGGLSLTFNKKSRGLLNKVWLDTGAAEWQEFSTLEEVVSSNK